MYGRLLWIALAAATLVAPLRAEQDQTPQDQLIHSDLPLYDFNFKDVWPRHFTDDDGSFGCTSRVAFGNWTFTDSEGDIEAWQIANYGVFHCAAVFRQAPAKADLDKAAYKYGLTVLLGTASQGGKPVELWAFQQGMRPGSDYVLLARVPGKDIVRSFSVLQRTCGKAQMLRLGRGQTLDVWSTSYCAINSRVELLSLAKKMLVLPPLGKLEWTEELPSS